MVLLLPVFDKLPGGIAVGLRRKSHISSDDIDWFMRVEREEACQTLFFVRRFGTFHLEIALQLREPEVGKVANAVKGISFLFIDIGNPERAHKDSPPCFYPTSKTIAVIFGLNRLQLRTRRSL